MRNTLAILHTQCRLAAGLLVVCASGTWVGAQELQKTADAQQFCAHAAPSQDPDKALERQEVIRREVTARVALKVAGSLKLDRDSLTAQLTLPLEIPLDHPATLQIQRAHQLDFKLEAEHFDDLSGREQLGVLDVELVVMALALTDQDIVFCEHDEVRQNIRVELMAARLLDENGKPLVESKTLLGREVAIRRSLGWPTYLGDSVPNVALRADKLSGEPSKLSAESWQPLQNKALSCYIPALKQNARLQGAVVLRWRAGSADATVLIDTLNDEGVAACIRDAAANLAAGAPDDGSVWRATVFVKLIPSSRL